MHKWVWASTKPGDTVAFVAKVGAHDVIYRFDTASGAVEQIKVGAEPHGLTVWPQPGRYSLGHTGNLR